MASELEISYKFDAESTSAKIEKRIDGIQKRLDAQVLKDSNLYCPMDTGTLQKSAIIHTKLGSGVITWRTPYARDQYYLMPNKSHQKNPRACQKWFEAAKAARRGEWIKIAHEEYKRNS